MNEKELSKKITGALIDKKGVDIVEIHVGSLTTLADYFILATGTSDRHMQTLADSVEEKMDEVGIAPRNNEERKNTSWILLDYGDVVVSIFDEDSRKLYNLERLWADGDIVRIEELIKEHDN